MVLFHCPTNHEGTMTTRAPSAALAADAARRAQTAEARNDIGYGMTFEPTPDLPGDRVLSTQEDFDEYTAMLDEVLLRRKHVDGEPQAPVDDPDLPPPPEGDAPDEPGDEEPDDTEDAINGTSLVAGMMARVAHANQCVAILQTTLVNLAVAASDRIAAEDLLMSTERDYAYWKRTAGAELIGTVNELTNKPHSFTSATEAIKSGPDAEKWTSGVDAARMGALTAKLAHELALESLRTLRAAVAVGGV